MKVFADRDWTIIFWTYFAVLMMLIACGAWVEAYVQQGRTIRAVYTICNESRLATNGPLEQACGDAQDASTSEFLCADNNQDPSTHCWVELK